MVLGEGAGVPGHPLGASGGIEAIACIKAMEESWLPLTLGLDEADPECGLEEVSNSFAFTGSNAVLIFGPPPQ